KMKTTSEFDVFLDDLERCRDVCFAKVHDFISGILRSTILSKIIIASSKFFKFVVSCSSPAQVADLCEMLERRDFSMFPSTATRSAELIFESISWEGF